MSGNDITMCMGGNLDAAFLHRPRIVKKIEAALQKSNLLVVQAGAGFGKTSAVLDYYRKPRQRPLWLPLTENDNIPAVFWNNFISLLPDYSRVAYEKFRVLSFPNTSQEYHTYLEEMRTGSGLSPALGVVDDLHLITRPEVINFLARSIEVVLHRRSKIILITRQPLPWLTENYELISEADLRLTEEEAYELFALRQVNCPLDFMQEVWERSEGWVFALDLISRKIGRQESLDEYFVNNTLRKNIFSYIEREVFSGLSDEEMRLLHTINVTGRMPLTYFDESRVAHNPLLSGFIHRNPQLDVVELHPVIADYLRTQPRVFTDEELREEYKKVARWCLKHNQRMLSAKYFAAAADYAALVGNATYEPLLIPRDRAEFYRELIENLAPDDNDVNYCLVRYIFYGRVLLSLRCFEETEKEIEATIERFSAPGNAAVSPLAARILASNYLSLAFLRHYICPQTHQYDFDYYASLAREWYVRAGVTEPIFFGQTNIAPTRTYNCLVGENPAPDEFAIYLPVVRDFTESVGQCLKGMYAGYDLLCEGEYYFYKNDLVRARELINQALAAHQSGNQFALMAYALHISMRICVCESDAEGISRVLQSYDRIERNEKFFARDYYCQLLRAWVCIQLGEPQKMPVWLKAGNSGKEKFEWIEEAESWTQARYYLKINEPEKILTSFYITGESDQVDRTYLGQLDRLVVMALALFQVGRREEAFAELRRGYELSRPDGMTIPFIEFGQDMAELCRGCLAASYPEPMDYESGALPGENGSAAAGASEFIPADWLGYICAQSEAYARKLAWVTGTLTRPAHPAGQHPG